MKKNKFLVIAFFALPLFVACGCSSNGMIEVEKPLARVFSQHLYPSDISDLIPEGAEDSLLIVDAYVQTWIRNKVMERMAELNTDADADIEKMVSDYKASLVLSKYEEALLQKNLDTTINETALREFYELNKTQFPLASPAVQFYYLKITRGAPDLGDVKRWMMMSKDNDLNSILNYAARNGVEFSFGNYWILLDELAAKLPEGTLKERYLLASKRDFYASDEKYRYFVKINDFAANGSPSPFPMIKNDLAKLVMKKKKLETLKNITEQIFKNELSKKNVEVY